VGWLEHGSTNVAVSPPEHRPAERLAEGRGIRMGEPLLRIG